MIRFCCTALIALASLQQDAAVLARNNTRWLLTGMVCMLAGMFTASSAWAQGTDGTRESAGGQTRQCTEPSPPIHFQTIREAGDSLFVLAWDEPLRWSQALYVDIYDERGLINWYHGLSTPMTHVGFLTQQDTVQIVVSHVDWEGGTGCRFLPMSVPLDIGPDNVRDTVLSLFLDARQLYLRYDDPQDVFIGLDDPMPGRYSWTALHLDGWYLNRLDGRIRSGAWWIQNRTVRYLANVAEWMIIEPNWHYYLPDAAPQTGQWWLQQKRLSKTDARAFQHHHFEAP